MKAQAEHLLELRICDVSNLQGGGVVAHQPRKLRGRQKSCISKAPHRRVRGKGADRTVMTEAPAVDPLAFVDDARCGGHRVHLWQQRAYVQDVVFAAACRATLAAQLDQRDVRKFRSILRDHRVVRDGLGAEPTGDERLVERPPCTCRRRRIIPAAFGALASVNYARCEGIDGAGATRNDQRPLTICPKQSPHFSPKG